MANNSIIGQGERIYSDERGTLITGLYIKPIGDDSKLFYCQDRLCITNQQNLILVSMDVIEFVTHALDEFDEKDFIDTQNDAAQFFRDQR